jgi:hypothetical protein
MYLPGMVEPVLMAASPSVHIEQLRPVVRVVMSDAVKQFGGSLLQARAVLKADMVNDLVDHILNPQLKPGPRQQPEAVPATTAVPTGVPSASDMFGESPSPSRARAIFHAAEEAKPFDPADLSFAFDESAEAAVPDNLRETSPSQLLGPAPRRSGLSRGQLAALAVMLLLECGVLGGFAYLIYFGTR